MGNTIAGLTLGLFISLCAYSWPYKDSISKHHSKAVIITRTAIIHLTNK